MLEFAILGLLQEQNLHGYELRRRIGELLGPIARLSFGTLYPALNRLEVAGAVQVLKITESRTGLTTTRGRKVYGITDKGRSDFGKILGDQSTNEDERDFALRLAFAEHLSREARMRLLSRRRDQLLARLHEAETVLSEHRIRLDDYRRSLMEHTNEVVKSDISWLDQLIRSEQKGLLQESSDTGGSK